MSPRKKNSLGRENTLKFALDIISGCHWLLHPPHYKKILWMIYPLFNVYCIPLNELSYVVSRTRGAGRQSSRGISSLKKKDTDFRSFWKLKIQFVMMNNLDASSSMNNAEITLRSNLQTSSRLWSNKNLQRKTQNNHRKLKNYNSCTYLEVEVHICILIVLTRETTR